MEKRQRTRRNKKRKPFDMGRRVENEGRGVRRGGGGERRDNVSLSRQMRFEIVIDSYTRNLK